MKICVPKCEIIYVLDMLYGIIKTPLIGHGQWLFQTLTLKEWGTMGFWGNKKGKIIGTKLLVILQSQSIMSNLLMDLSIIYLASVNFVIVVMKWCLIRTPANDSDKSIIFIGKRKDNVYKINFFKLADQKIVFLLSVSDEKWLWHKRLGHANGRLISKLGKLKLVKGLPKLNYHLDALYGACQKGKIVKTSFKPICHPASE